MDQNNMWSFNCQIQFLFYFLPSNPHMLLLIESIQTILSKKKSKFWGCPLWKNGKFGSNAAIG